MDAFQSLAQEKQHRILDAALAEFAARGYQGASTNTITKEAGISKGALFHYFGSKKALYVYLMHYTRQLIGEYLLADFPKSTDLIEIFLILGRRKAELARTHPLFFDFLFKVFLERPDNPEFQRITEQWSDVMKLLMNENIDTSLLREGIDLEKAIDICSWMAEGFSRKYSLAHKELSPEDILGASEELMKTLRILIYKERQ